MYVESRRMALIASMQGGSRDADTVNRLGDVTGEGGGGMH